MRNLFRLVLVLLLTQTACQGLGGLPQLIPPGVLQGHVDIGPLSPVQRIGVPPPTVPPEVYAARQVVIYKEDGQTELTRLKLDANGNYRVQLAPGNYVVGMARVGIDRARGLPANITISSNVTTTLDISVDTGIR